MVKTVAKNSNKKAIGFNFQRPQGAITSLNSITSELAKVQYIMYDVAVDLKVAVVTAYVIAARRDEYRSIHATEQREL